MGTKKLVEKTYNKLAPVYDNFLGGVNEIIKILPKYLKHGKILDIGCGTGEDLKFLSKFGFELYGIDLSEKMVEIAKKKVRNAKIFRLDVREVDKLFPNDYFDCVLAMYSIVHLPKKEVKEVLRKIKKILKKDGLLVLGMLLGEGEKTVQVPFRKELKYFVSLFKENEIISILSNLGFIILKKIHLKPETYEIKFDRIEIISKKKGKYDESLRN